MLTVAKVTAGGGARYAAYLEGKTQPPEQGDYYLRDGERVEAPGRWALGADGASALGVDRDRPVQSEAFRSLMGVRHPVTGEQLRAVGANGEAVVAIDATFSAPKSVSAVWALSSPELRLAIEAAHERAIDRALQHARELVPMVRRRVDRKTVVRETAREILATSWRQSTARAVAGRPPDPQLHSHVLIHGALRSDGRIVAVESRAWMVHQREIAAAYRSRFAAELRSLGFEIERGTGRGGRYFEVAGVPDGLRERWSARHREVSEAIEQRLAEKRLALETQIAQGGAEAAEAANRLDALERSGRLMPAEERRLAVSSRAGKGTLVTAGDLDREWWQTAVEFDFDARSVEALRDRAHERVPRSEIDGELLSRLTEFDATFATREARATALEVACDLGPEHGLAALDRLHKTGQLIELADGRMTTRVHRALERETIAIAEGLAAARGKPVDALFARVETDALRLELAEHGATLAAEQEHAIAAACSDRQMVVIVGQAGTGKSTALLGIARAHEQDGRSLLVTSTGAQAAERLALELREGGVDAHGYSTAALRANVEAGRLSLDRAVSIIHDEAALASTREQRWLLAAARDSGARLIATGDPRQSQAVGAGGLWPQLEALAAREGALVELTRIVRARDPADRRDQALFRAGEHERAIKGYLRRGRVVFDTDQRRMEDRALDAAQGDRLAGRSTLVIAETSNERLDMLNARAQAIRAQEGELGRERLSLRERPYGLRAGDQIVVRAPVIHPDLGPVRNGAAGEVLHVDAARNEATLRLADGREAGWDRRLLDVAQTRLAYVSHPFPAQGRTSDTAHLIVGPHASAEGSYVAITRARDQTRLYAARDQLELPADAPAEREVRELAQRLGRSEPEMPSISVSVAHERRVEREHAQQALADRTDAARAIEHPDEHLTRVIGERPDTAQIAQREAWDEAALAIEAAHERAIDPSERTALGPRPHSSRASYEQLADWQRMGERIIDARERLGIAMPGLGTIEERLAKIAGVMPERDIERSRGRGR